MTRCQCLLTAEIETLIVSGSMSRNSQRAKRPFSSTVASMPSLARTPSLGTDVQRRASWPLYILNYETCRRPFFRISPDELTGTSFLVGWIARQIFSGVIGMSIWVTPNSASASSAALATAPSAPVVPPSPAPRTPSRFVGVGTSLISVVNDGKRSARGIT